MKIKLWGVRGSLPTPEVPSAREGYIKNLLDSFYAFTNGGEGDVDDYIRTLKPYEFGGYGGNTACAEVTSAEQTLIIDGGSGIVNLGKELMKGPCGEGKGVVSILMTHFHWDHIVGLPFFVPIFIPGNKINFYSVDDTLEENIKIMFTKPNFPVAYENLASDITFNKLEKRKPAVFKDMSVTPYRLDHPDPCWGYRIESEGKVLSYCVDTEGMRVSKQDLGADLPLYQDVDLLIFDAQYTLSEAAEKIDWGHSSAPIGLDIALREGIKRVYFVHHDPNATDEKIESAKNETCRYFEARLSALEAQGNDPINVLWDFASEELEIEI